MNDLSVVPDSYAATEAIAAVIGEDTRRGLTVKRASQMELEP